MGCQKDIIRKLAVYQLGLRKKDGRDINNDIAHRMDSCFFVEIVLSGKSEAFLE